MTIPNRWGLPNLGFGLGLRSEFQEDIEQTEPDVDWFEIISENYLESDGRPRQYLDYIRERYPVVMHGVGLSIGSTDPLDLDYLKALKALADRIGAVWMSDHVCWTGVNGHFGHDLYPIPYNQETLDHLIERVRQVQDVIERPLILENPSTYVTFSASTMTEQRFIRQLANEADCGLLLDVNNVYVQARNHDFSMWDYLDEVPFDRVVQIHLAGHSDMGTHCIDTHDNYVVDDVWKLYAEVIRRAGNRSTMVEWDDHIPAFEIVHQEVLKAKELLVTQGLHVAA